MTSEFSRTEPNKNALGLDWSFGFNKDINGGVHNLSDDIRNSVFYVAGHTGIIYDFQNRRQQLLQGHCNPITTCCSSEDKRWIATADSGSDSMIVVWDSITATPIKTIFNPHPNGVITMSLSPDAMFIATLSKPSSGTEAQEIALWEWTNERDGPLYRAKCVTRSNENFELQTSICFNSSDIQHIMSNGDQRVIFWSWESKEFKLFSPPLSNQEFKHNIGTFMKSVFLPGTTQAVTATSDGDVILWDRSIVDDTSDNSGFDKRAVKLVRLTDTGGISFITTQGNFFVTGSEDGSVRFYDFQFRLISWYEDLNAGPVTSLSFSNSVPPEPSTIGGFTVENFVVGTRKALIVGCEASMFEEIVPQRRRGTLLVQGFDSPVRGVTSHPYLPNLAACCDSGTIQLWDYQMKRLLMVRIFEPSNHIPVCLSFDPHGRFLAVGFSSGVLATLDADTLTDLPNSAYMKYSTDAIHMIKFSLDSTFMATADSDNAVAIYRFMQAPKPSEPSTEDTDLEINETEIAIEEWVYLGKIRSHSAPITGLEFSVNTEGHPLLISVSQDRHLAEYDLLESSVPRGILLSGSRHRLERSAVPTACIWHPYVPGSREELIITSNDDYKFKIWNANKKTCRKTVLAPTYGGPLNKLLLLPNNKADNGDSQYLVYSTHEKVIGLVKFDLDGNPNKAMGLIAHPGIVEDIVTSFDGTNLITVGGGDCCINVWTVNTTAIDESEASGGKGADSFIALIDGGTEGAFYQEIIDYFYYAQLRSQGESCTAPREIKGAIPLAEIPNLMRALGFYPTEQEVENMTSEVKYSKFASLGEPKLEIGLDELIRLYVNHRPVFGIGKAQLQEAFKILSGDMNSSELPWKGANGLATLLTRFGETMSEHELNACLNALAGENGAMSRMKADEFASTILGFEDYEK